MKRKFHGHWMTFKIIFFVFPGWRYEWKRRSKRAARTCSGEIGNANYLWLCSRLCAHASNYMCMLSEENWRSYKKKKTTKPFNRSRSIWKSSHFRNCSHYICIFSMFRMCHVQSKSDFLLLKLLQLTQLSDSALYLTVDILLFVTSKWDSQFGLGPKRDS